MEDKKMFVYMNRHTETLSFHRVNRTDPQDATQTASVNATCRDDIQMREKNAGICPR